VRTRGLNAGGTLWIESRREREREREREKASEFVNEICAYDDFGDKDESELRQFDS